MHTHEQHDHDYHDLPARHRALDLWFYEQRGSRYYLRLTRFAVALILVPVLLSMVAIVAFYFYKKSTPAKKPDININVSSAPASPPKTLIKMAPQPTPPRVRNRQNVNANNPLIAPTPGRNANER